MPEHDPNEQPQPEQPAAICGQSGLGRNSARL
jgi:hypothetical protein